MRLARNQQGDTIIEVLFAITIFSLIAVGGLSLMHQGSTLAERALQISHVRQQIDAQADALRYLNKAYVADFGRNGAATTLWKHVVEDNQVTQAEPFEEISDRDGCHLPGGDAFAINTERIDTDLMTNPSAVDISPVLRPTADTMNYSRIRYDPEATEGAVAEGIWIEAVRSIVPPGDPSNLRPGFYDFHIRACWYSVGDNIPMVSGTIVRLYEPRGE